VSAGRYAFVVAVVGDPDVMTAAELRRLLEGLVARHRDDRRIWLVSAGGRGPDLSACNERGWTLLYEPAAAGPVKQDCALAACADAVVVLGDPRPWARLLALCAEARTPTRVYRTRPRLPPVRRDIPEGLTGDG
jgi:hypothetical protein